jgi:hypothetical protein
MNRIHYTIWQCTDWCCERKSHADRWWNIGMEPGRYLSIANWSAALALAESGALA